MRALRLTQKLEPDVLLTEAELPDLAATEVTRRLRERAVPVPVLVLSARAEAPLVSALLRAGAAGYLTKDEAPEQVARAVLGVARGQKAWFSPRVLERLRVQRAEPAPKAPLSPRELDVLGHIARGLEGKAIAEMLHVTPGTVKLHVEHILEKLGAHTRAHAVALAYSRGLLSPLDDPPGRSTL